MKILRVIFYSLNLSLRYQNKNDYSPNWHSSTQKILFFIYFSIEIIHNYSYLISISLIFSLILVIFRAFQQIFYTQNYIFYWIVFRYGLLIIWNLLLIQSFSFATLINSNHSSSSSIDFHQCLVIKFQNYPIWFFGHWTSHQFDINWMAQNPFLWVSRNIFLPGLLVS